MIDQYFQLTNDSRKESEEASLVSMQVLSTPVYQSRIDECEKAKISVSNT